MEFVDFQAVCSHCGNIHKESVRFFAHFYGEILKSFWCQHCGGPLIVKYRFTHSETPVVATVTQHIENRDSVLCAHRSDFGYTARNRHFNEHEDLYDVD